MMISRKDHRVNLQRGFTLIEVLVVLAITSVLMASLYSAFFLSHKAVDAVDDSLVRTQEGRAVLDVIKREMESAVCETGNRFTFFKIDDRDIFGKQTSRLSFTSLSPLLPGLVKIDYAVEESDGKLILKKQIRSAFSKSDGKNVELMEDVESFAAEARFGDKWVKTWDSALSGGAAPEEVRISVKFHIKNGESPLVVSDIARPKYNRII